MLDPRRRAGYPERRVLRNSGSLVRVVRRLAAVVVLIGWMTPLAVPHKAGDDPVCVVGLSSEETPDRLSRPSVASTPEHCLVCHLARSFRSTLTGGERVALWLVAGQVVPAWSDESRRDHDVDQLPARTPPAFPVAL